MKILSVLGFLVAGLAALVGVGSFPVEGSLAGRAELIQRVEVLPADQDPFGDGGTPIGSPQKLIIDDPKAFLEGTTPEGVRMVSDNYLRDNGIYPLQLKTVEYLAGTVRLAALGGVVVGGLLGWWARGRSRRAAAGSVATG